MTAQAHTLVLWRADIAAILRGVTAAYLAGAAPRDAALVLPFAQAVAAAFDVTLEQGAIIDMPRLEIAQ